MPPAIPLAAKICEVLPAPPQASVSKGSLPPRPHLGGPRNRPPGRVAMFKKIFRRASRVTAALVVRRIRRSRMTPGPVRTWRRSLPASGSSSSSLQTAGCTSNMSEGGAAQHSGILEQGDCLMLVDGVKVFGKPSDYVSSKIMGSVGTPVATSSAGTLSTRRQVRAHSSSWRRCSSRPDCGAAAARGRRHYFQSGGRQVHVREIDVARRRRKFQPNLCRKMPHPR